MAIRVKCGQCGKTLSAPDSADGRKGKCPNCGNVVTLKAAAPAAETAPFELDDAFSSQLDESTPSTPPVEERTVHGSRRVEPSPAVRGGGAAFGGRGARAGVEEPALGRSFASPMSGGTGYSRRYLYWLLALLFIPLAMSLLGGESDLEDRLSRSLAQHSDAIEKLPETAGEEEFFAVFPDHRIEGALLSRDTKMHWLFAALATAGFFAAAYFLLEQGGARLTSYFSIGMFTATVGIIALTLGGLVGGWIISLYGLKRMLWPMILAMHTPIVAFLLLAIYQPSNLVVVSAALAVEQFGYGFGFTAYMLYMMLVAEGPHKTAHYAICTGFMALGMMLPGMAAGWIQDHIGYVNFFAWVLVCTLPSFVTTALASRTIDPAFGRKNT